MIEIFRSYLEIKKIDDLNETAKPNENCKIELINPPNLQLNKFFYKQIGKNHRWIDRLSWNDRVWRNYLDNTRVSTYVIKENNDLAGYFEQIYNEQNNDFEIAYFGILEEFRQRKYGSYLLSDAIKSNLKIGARRVWVHTCSLDHKNAIKNYISRGMKVFKEEKIKIPA